MNIINWKNWSVRTRILVIAFVPVVYLFISVITYSYYSHKQEAKLELAERAHMVSTALADGLAYPLLSGNMQGLKQMIHSVVQSDKSIYRIEVLNSKKEKVSFATSYGNGKSENHYIERAIKRHLVWVNLLGQPTKLEQRNELATKKKEEEIIGYVRVYMSPTHMVNKQKHHFTIELMILVVAMLVSAMVGRILSHSLTEPLNKAMEVIKQIRLGNTEQKIQISTGGEIGHLQLSINEMAESLQIAKEHLERKVEERTKELLHSRNEALKADAEKRSLIQKINTIVENERQSIAVEIHDELNATLIAIRLESERIAKLSIHSDNTEQNRSNMQEANERAKKVIALALSLYANGRNLVQRLRPEVLDMLGLEGALEEMVRMYNQAQADCHFQFHSQGNLLAIDKDYVMPIYRIIQEASSNVLKHAKAKNVTISLNFNQENAALYIEIQDDGIGFDTNQAVTGIGLAGMRERIAALFGRLEIRSELGKGSKISMMIPKSS